jgi:DNA-directed RNA polymerase specialized sigma subunit
VAKRVDESAWSRESATLLPGLRARRAGVRSAAIARLCELFDPLAKSLARGYQQDVIGGDYEELEQVARVGLLEAIQTFRPKRGAFPSHAMWSIRNALSKYVETLGNPIVLPAWMIRRLPKMKRAFRQLAQELLREPTTEEVAVRMKMPLRAINAMLTYNDGAGEMPQEIDGAPWVELRVHGDDNTFMGRSHRA